MKYFIGIVPPEAIYNKLLNIQQQHGDNRLEPHITLRPPVTPINDQQWLDIVMSNANMAVPFEVKLPGTGTFGSRVMFVRVESPGLESLHEMLIPKLKTQEPGDGKKDHERFHPHLTLGRAWRGFTPEDFRSMKQLADEYLVEKEIAFMVSQLRTYYKPDPHKGYQAYKDVPLGVLN